MQDVIGTPWTRFLQRYNTQKYFFSKQNSINKCFYSEAIMKRPNYLRSSFVFLPKNQHKAMEVVHFYTHLFFAHSKWYHEWVKLLYFIYVKTTALFGLYNVQLFQTIEFQEKVPKKLIMSF